MNRTTTLLLCLILTVSPVAQAAFATPAAEANDQQRAPERTIHCAQDGAATATPLQPCKVQGGHDAIHMGSDVSRQEFECVLSGNCGAGARSRVSG